ncbi:Ig family protein [Chthoniobacter flavus Ellin428]|uniref:Ig family protein n=2 Tax=Chthoniobacter flavus TaxID=191863 RepID=B4D7X4_9BACT|nr:Ig family protein [Chthoniobacter flavus Ellin428]TCO92292.1 uncharacterized protein DUF1349 [Chthoniobacter flavus]
MVAALAFSSQRADAGTWTPLTNSPPSGPNLMSLLSDGSVLVQGGGTSWYRLKPDIHGSYVNGTWTTLGSMHDTRQYYSQQVLKDGRVFVAGGEYGTGGHNAEVFDPLTNSWTITPSSGQDFIDSISEILGDGRVMVGPVGGPASTVIYDPVANTWATGPATLHGQDEVPWLKLPDGSILCVDGSSQSERYIPSLNQWVADTNTPVVLYSGGETGSGHMLANGKALFRGYTHTAIYTPSGTSSPGSWVAGPDVPGGLNCGDSPGAVMVNGNVLFVGGPGYLTGPTSFFEYDATANTISQVNGPTGTTYNGVPYGLKMLALPDGNVLVNVGGALYEYVPAGSPTSAFQPAITSITHNADGTYQLAGTNLNGFSEGAAYGDDFQMATNRPIVRFADSSGNIYYARTGNWSSTGVQTGATAVTTGFTLPLNLPAGTYNVAVVANGIASSTVTLTTPYVAGDAAPTVATPAAASPGTVTGLTTNLSVLGADTDGGGESNIVYTWVIASAPTGVSTPSFSINGTNAAKNTAATFHHGGAYTFTVTMTDSSGLSVTSSVNVTVNQALTSATVSPATASLTSGQTQQLSATGLDQFGVAMAVQPTFTWAVTAGGGTVGASGLYTSPGAGTLATVTATTGAVQVSATVAVVSSPWVSAEIGSPALGGSAYDSSGTFTVNGEGSDIWGTADEFHYVYRTLNGDGVIIARVATQQNTNAWAKAGVMIRESTDAGAINAFMAITPGNGTTFQSRTATGGSSTSNNTSGRAAPYWVKLVRSGSTITGYSSSNGTTWNQQSSATVSMTSPTVLIGLAVCSHDTSALCTATFDNISVMVAQNDSLAVNPGGAGTVNVLANDTGPSGATLTVTNFTQGAKGTVTNSGAGNLTYTAASTAIGSDSFSYTVSDGLGDIATATVNVFINGLRAYYKFEEGSGTTSADATGDGYTCTLHGATWATGVEGTNGLAFAGTSSSYATIPALNFNTNTMTVTGWVLRNGSQSSWTGLVFCRAGTTACGLHFGTANELRYTWNNSSSTYNWNSGLTVPNAQWTFVALVITPTNASIYMQPLGGGMISATNNVANSSAAFDGSTTFGQDPNGQTRYFNGSLDEVRIYNTSLDASAIAGLAVATPTVATAAAANPSPTTTFNTTLSALGTSNIYPESGLTYTWSATGIPAGATLPSIAGNGSNTAKSASVTLYQSGSYTFQVTITDAAGGSVSNSVTLTANLAPYDNWRGQQFGVNATNDAISGLSADPDGDGLSNLLEYALGTSPGISNKNTIVTDQENISGQKYLRLTIARNPNATDVQFIVEATSTLGNGASWSSSGLITEVNTATQLIVRDNVPVSGGSQRYLRLRLVKP